LPIAVEETLRPRRIQGKIAYTLARISTGNATSHTMSARPKDGHRTSRRPRTVEDNIDETTRTVIDTVEEADDKGTSSLWTI
jgi:hypothetical protein